ncbi:actin-like protein arp8 [Coemansia javaensis]|uniref:Actin-like protein arp8 n=1 Tax=Coemansia javaensis TaxID=2761396 RepID=A0A9W8LHD8_9FUNG|nr:actin-like protein arp8 [Coemansia javaensis]
MSGFGSKIRKKYSWLPETNPAALSGEANPAPASGEANPPTSSAAGRGRGRGRGIRDRERDAAASGNSNGNGSGSSSAQAAAVDALGIVTQDVADGDAASVGSSSAAAAAAAAPAAQGVQAGRGRRRRSRKDSVDDLVRSRFITTMGAQRSDGSPPPLRRDAEHPPMAAITATVRDALAHEHSATATAAAAAAAPRARNGHRSAAHQHHHHHSHHSHHSHSHHHPNGGASSRRPPSPLQPQLGPIDSQYSFPAYTPLNPRNVTSTLRRSDQGIGAFAHPAAAASAAFEVPTGENVVVIHPGSRWLRIGRASDAVPRAVPHVIARRLRTRPAPAAHDNDSAAMDVDNVNTGNSSVDSAGNDSAGDGDDSAPATGNDNDSEDDSDNDDDDDDDNGDSDEDKASGEELSGADAVLKMLRTALKEHQRLSKRKAAPNAYAQVMTYNRKSKPEEIQDHNDPFRVEWIPSAEAAGDWVVGESALRLADPGEFSIRYPMRNGCFNIEDYAGPEDVLGDIQTIWEHALEAELGIRRRDLGAYGVVLVIPDIYSRPEVIALAEMLLRRMGFQRLLLQQSSALVTFGAGFSSACVVDVGAQKTSVCCVDEGYCAQESRVSTMCGGDDITRFLFNLLVRSNFPYREASLQRLSDWALLEDMRERFCTVNLSDVNIRLRDFFVRRPHEHTRKYTLKTYDEVYQAPLCLFYPEIMDALYRLPDYAASFANAHYPETYGESKPVSDVAVMPSQFGILPSRAIEVAASAADTAVAVVAEPAAIDSAAAAAADSGTVAAADGDASIDAVGGGSEGMAPGTESATPDATQQQQQQQQQPAAVASEPSVVRYVPDPDAQRSRMPLDAAITHSIAHAGSIDRAKKLYTSIVIVGGGVSFIPGFADVLASRLIHMRPSYLHGVDRADIVSAPRDLDPRVLAWKGGAVLSRLDCAREMWLSARDWADFGPRLLRDRLLFPW